MLQIMIIMENGMVEKLKSYGREQIINDWECNGMNYKWVFLCISC